jgi:hypothetical protein
MKKKIMDFKPPRTVWHPAFIQALKMELKKYHNVLEFHTEFQLTSEPLKIDCVVIKKKQNIKIDKNIAAIFRNWNIIEYKSPTAYFSISNFYKVYGYACLYASFESIPITNITISFIGSCNPRNLLKHLQNVHGYTVEKTYDGVYTVKGDIVPIQFVNSRLLSPEENLWLKSLSNRIKPSEFFKLDTEITRNGKAEQLAAYTYAIAQANPAIIREAIKMSNARELEKVIVEVGWAAKWEAKAEARGKAIGEAQGKAIGKAQGKANERKQVLKLLNQGLSAEELKRRLTKK